MSIRDSAPFLAGSFTDLDGAHRLFGEFPQYEHILGWIEEFVLLPHPRLGRAGAVCPRLSASIDHNTVRLVAVATVDATVEAAQAVAPHLARLFIEVFGDRSGSAFRRGVLLACFPDLDPADAGAFIDGGHARVRADFVRQGLMLGEFHRASAVGSVHNPALPVMRSPAPMWAVRALTAHDHLFLDRPGEHRAELLSDYLTHVGDHAPREVADRIRATLATTATTEN